MKIKNVLGIIVGFLIACSGLSVIGSMFKKPDWDMSYQIINYAGMEPNGYMEYNQTFKVKGTVTIQNYESEMIVITADAVGNLGGEIHIFTVVRVSGDGTYDFEMGSFYAEGVEYVVSIKNMEVKDYKI
ncbi:MAG: hypothetical protein IJW28_00240 [Clostridia bacterium]|nr:hypothetical protein [Clostridia bacterium]